MNYSKIENCGIPLYELADKLGMSRSGFYKAIKNKTLKVETLEELSSILNVSIDFFFADDDNKLKLAEERIERLKRLIERLTNLLVSIKEQKTQMGHYLIFIILECHSVKEKEWLMKDENFLKLKSAITNLGPDELLFDFIKMASKEIKIVFPVDTPESNRDLMDYYRQIKD